MKTVKTVVALAITLAAASQAQTRPQKVHILSEVWRDLSERQGPGGVLNDRVEAWVRGNDLHFRSAKAPLATEFQVIDLEGPARKMSADEDYVYVWVGESQLNAYRINEDGTSLDPSPRLLGVDDEAAVRALNRHTVPPELGSPEVTAFVNPQKLFVTHNKPGLAGSISGDSLGVINTASNTLSAVILLDSGNAPSEVAVTADNLRGYTTNFGCNTCSPRELSMFDPTTNNLQGRFPTGTYPYALAVSSDGSRLYVGDDTNTLTIYDQAGKILNTRNLPVFAQRMALTSNNRYLVVAMSDGSQDQALMMDTTTFAMSPVVSFPYGSFCAGLTIAPGDTKAFVGCFKIPKIFTLIIVNGTLVQSTSVNSSPTFALAASPDGKKLYVAYNSTGAVDVLDATSLARMTQIPTHAASSTNIIVNKAGTRAYVANTGNASVSVLNLTDNTNVTTIPVGPGPYGLALTTAPAAVSISPAKLSFSGTVDQPFLASQDLALSLDQAGSYTWTANINTMSGGNWITLSAATGTFPATLKVTASVGTLAAGTYTGTIFIAAANTGNSPLTIAVSMTVNPNGVLSVSKTQLSFAGIQGAPAPSTVTLGVTNTGLGGAIAWTASVTGSAAPWLILSPPSGTTPGTLQVGVNPQGLAPGTVSATVSFSSPGSLNPVILNITFAIAPGPVVSAGGIVNAASFAANTAVSAGALVSIFGSNFGPAAAIGSSSLPLPTTLGGVQVLMGGKPAPLIFVSASQINCQVPFEIAGLTSVQVVVMNNDAPSAGVTMQLAPASPGIFTAVVAGKTVGAILKADYSLITSDNPAKIGDVIQIFANGQGAVSNPPASGAAAPSTPPLALTVANPVVLVGGQPASLAFSGLSPGFVGLWQVNVTIPSGVTPGSAVSVQIVQNGLISNSANIAVVSQ